MFKFITSTAAAAALALTSFAATPAQAGLDRGETIRLLLGLGAIGALVVANDRSKDRRRSAQTYRNEPPVIRVTPGDRDRYQQRQALPARCATDVPTRSGERTYYGQPCLDRYGFTAALPSQCARTLDFGRRQVRAYGEQCLRRNGYRVRG